MANVTDDRIWRRTLFEHLQREAIEPTDRWYVDLFERGVLGPDEIPLLAEQVSFMPDGEMAFLSGLRGSGKSTQLLRLAKLLREEGLAVVRLDAEDLLNVRSPIDETQLLVALAGGIPEQAAETYDLGGLKANPTWNRLRDWLRALPGRVAVEPEATVSTGALMPFLEGSMKVSLRTDESFARQVQEFLSGRTGELLEQANAYVLETIEAIKAKFSAEGRPWGGLVVIVDSLDHVRGSATDEDDFQRVRESLERLFTARRNAISLRHCRFVYCLPPFVEPGGVTRGVPHVRIRTRDGAEDADGVAALRDVVRRRAPEENVERLLSEAQLHRLITESGGSLRDLFRLVQDVALSPQLPAADETVEAAIANLARSMDNVLTDVDRACLADIAETKRLPKRDHQSWAHLAPLFDRYIVLRYRNGDEWYDVHPLVAAGA